MSSVPSKLNFSTDSHNNLPLSVRKGRGGKEELPAVGSPTMPETGTKSWLDGPSLLDVLQFMSVEKV